MLAAREHPFYYDGDLRMWIASSAQAVEAVLLHEAFRVRPLSEPVPAQIAGTASGDLFGRFMRMTDGSDHAQLKNAGAASDFSASFSQESTRVLLEEIGFARGPLFEAFGEAAARLDREAVLANAAAFLFQSCEATAGLIGNALRALAADPQQEIEPLVAQFAHSAV